ncbi:nitrate- and nitrite sensing domain-containing protein [Amycolatopsis antarctica]|uniref:sensor histidine kinase n=1 Tax=Amycolatopsis antarctica TaxID=1854586 RepID=UPI001F0AE239|nr:nitrate- and nitrite sensing domain-containing protein [Amycolatopsis antarctica]
MPSFALLLIGATLAGYLIYQSVKLKDFADQARESVMPVAGFVTAVQEERRLTLEQLAAPADERRPLDEPRQETDQAREAVTAAIGELADGAPPAVSDAAGRLSELTAQLAVNRAQADAGQLSPKATFDYYNELLDVCAAALQGAARDAPDAEVAAEQVTALQLFASAEGMARGHALATVADRGEGFSAEDFRGYVEEIGGYHSQLTAAVPGMAPEVRASYDQLVAGDPWAKVTTVENTFVERGLDQPGGRAEPLPVEPAEWQAAARQVADQLLQLYTQHTAAATVLGTAAAEDSLITTLIGATAVVLAAVTAFLVALRLSNRLVGRLQRLREETFDLADERLPRIVERLRTGRPVDLDDEVAPLYHGTDEIGQVAEAFNTAQFTAVAAAVQEAETREGTRTVFLDIAHRSQVIAHKQLEVLDEAERRQEDPEHLDLLFKLDHFATRARRNAENLIILGGERPGRQWRNPVPVVDVARSALSETEDYTRVAVGQFPPVAVDGAVVADLIHLLAELVDNATTYSPPESPVRLIGNASGRDLVLEVEDQGLGIDPARLTEFNATLDDPPDFSVMALSSEPRLGLFVVGQLAVRHGISVTLRESVYGGVRAVVLVPEELLTESAAPAQPEPEAPRRAQPDEGAAAPRLPRPRRRPRPYRAPVTGPPKPYAVPAFEPEPAPAAEPASVADPAPSPELPVRQPSRGPVARRSSAEETPEVTVQLDAVRSGEPAWPAVEEPAAEPEPAGGLFVDRHPAPSQAEQPPVAAHPPVFQQRSVAEPAPDGAPPPLPKRRRQRNLAPQLESPPQRHDEQDQWVSPERARQRLSAFQDGTRRARQEQRSQ